MLDPHDLPPVTEIERGLFIGNFYASKNIRILMKHEITAMVSVGFMKAREWDGPGHRMLIAEEDHLIVPCADDPTEDLLSKLPDICDFIESRIHPKMPDLDTLLATARHREFQNGLEGIDLSSIMQSHNVLVHCYLGVSRSAAVVAAYLMRKHRKSRDEVLALMKRKRRVDPNSSFLSQLKTWEELDYCLWEDKEKKVPKGLYQFYMQSMAMKKVRISQQRLEPLTGW